MTFNVTGKLVNVRSVWAHNLEYKFEVIHDAIESHPFAAVVTEFPDVIFRSQRHPRFLSPAETYTLLKCNVGALNLIQLGLTLSDATGTSRLAWEFNFSDFDLRHGHLHSPESIALLKSHGINFDHNREQRIDSCRFAELFWESGLICNGSRVSWIVFHGASDLGYLLKALNCGRLPMTLNRFMGLIRVLFGDRVFDVKQMMRSYDGLFGGLDQVSTKLGVERVVGQSHQAGSDSLVTMQTFMRMKEIFFPPSDGGDVEKHAGLIFGL